MSISMFDTRTMLAALEQVKPAKTFFLDKFFGAVNIATTKYVDIDIQKGKRSLAPFVSPRMQGKVVERAGFTTYTYAPPYIKPKMVTTAEDLLTRQMGNTIYQGNNSPSTMAEQQLSKDLAALDEMITRREEWMAAKALLTGKVPIVGDGVDDEIDFSMADTHKVTLAGGDLWNAGTSTPLEDLEDWAELIAQDAGLAVDVIVMGKDAARAFISNADVQKKLDNWRMTLGRIAPEQIAPGIRIIGAVDAVATIYVYHEWFVDPATNTETAMMDPSSVLLGSTQARCVRQYGAIQDLDANQPYRRFPKSWKEEDPSARFLMLQSAPLPTPHQVDGFVCAKVV